MIKFVWFGLVCCGVANGLVYSYVQSPGKYAYMLAILILCCIFLAMHRYGTRTLCEINKEAEMQDYDEEHPAIFIHSFLVVFVALLIACLVGCKGCIVATATMMITFIVAAVREAMYT